jgi:SAM-dependent methyltransferase
VVLRITPLESSTQPRGAEVRGRRDARSGFVLAVLGAVLSAAPVGAQRVQPDAPYVPTPPAVVTAMLETARVTADDVVFDLGSGDGRIVIAAAARFGARGLGVEIDPDLVRLARDNARNAGVDDRVNFVESDLFEVDLHEATVVTLYLLPILNYRLQPKLLEQLRPGARVVSHAFDMADWNPDLEFQIDDRWVFFWIVPARVEGVWEWTRPDSRTRVRANLTRRFQYLSGQVLENGAEVELLEPLIRGADITFTTASSAGGVPVRSIYRGIVEGDTVTGTVEVHGGGQTGTYAWEAQRISEPGG